MDSDLQALQMYVLHRVLPLCLYVSEKIIKMENSLLVIFDEIWPKTLYYSTGTLARFWSNFKNSDWNQLETATQYSCVSIMSYY